jgi:ATP-dependent DNA helicase RecG
MRHGQTWTNQSFRETFPMDSREARAELAGLVEVGVATADGERGGRVYRIAAHLTSDESETSPVLTTSAMIAPEFAMKEGNSATVNQPPSGRRKNWELIGQHLQTGEMTAAEIIEATGLTARQVQYALQQMRETGLVILIGSQGHRDSRYRTGSPPPSVPTTSPARRTRQQPPPP